MSARADIMAFIGANARGFHDAMTRVRGDAKNTAQSAQRDFSMLSSGIDRSTNLLKASLAGLGVGLSLQGAKEIISDIASIDREARRAGISIKAFQEMKYVAEKNRIDVDAMIDGMKELSLRADEFAVTGKGSASEGFQRLGFGAKDVANRLKEPSQLFVEIIGRVKQLNKAAQIRIMDELFGGSAGERFVELIAQGEDGIRRAIDEAHKLGIVMDDELVKKAAELDAAFNTVVTTVSSNLKQAVVSVASEIRYVLDLFNTAENRTISTLEQQLAEKRREREAMDAGGLRGFVARGKDGGRIPVVEAEISALEKLIQTKKENQKLPERKTDEVKLPPTGLKVEDGKSGKSKSISEAERQKKAADELIKSLELEYSLIGQTATQQKIATEIRKLGAGATKEQKDRITELITVIDAQKAAQDRTNKSQKDFIDGLNQLESDAVDALGNVIAGTEDAGDAFKKLAIEIVKSAITGKGAYADFFNSLFGGSGNIGLGGFIGGLLGFGGQKSIAMNGGIGLYANGGISDKPAIFGEAGTEAAVPLPDGRSIPVDLRLSDLPSAPQEQRSSPVITLSPVYQIDMGGSNADEATIRKAIEDVNKRTLPKLAEDIKELHMRGML
ncbi:hypothetical protein [Brucella anthropi]|uniref:hypothetical protein n=1 Tax=Brucella anthropi TaxID=529 RepID=UPI00124DCB99|nr:hypothetical protein [Brucella anthropi]KAB2724136.1 hypothetical protein F9K76_20220 [Brucella anthropi]KAB2739669.1 hypothetical protein F9K74_18375 [Brucella anthropi]KAB2802028.1 hypothetical protein F9K83_18370 [Brucella anthropi]